MERKWAAWLCGVLALALAGCASTHDPVRRLAKAEDVFDTGGPIRRQYHAVLYYPSEISLRFDGYILGIEKSPKKSIGLQGSLPMRNLGDSGLGGWKLDALVDAPNVMWVSHVMKTHGENAGAANCTLYNAYAVAGKDVPKQLVRPCDGQTEAWEPTSAYRNSWLAMDSLKQSLKKDLEGDRYTHLLVVVMGWNTIQEEATRNINSLTLQVVRASEGKIRPLVVGVTWPSEWGSDWVDPLFKLASFPVKATDADEVGLTWLGVLLHDVIPQDTVRKPVAVIGHSFGSRASAVATCIGPAIYRDSMEFKPKQVNLLFNFQGAFGTSRLFEESEGRFKLPKRCANAQQFVMTASKHDQAVTMAVWGKYAGGQNSFNDYCSRNIDDLACAVADKDGQLQYRPERSSGRITYVDASELITDNAYGTGGGAHSDIYRFEHGRLLTQFLLPKADGRQRPAALRINPGDKQP